MKHYYMLVFTVCKNGSERTETKIVYTPEYSNHNEYVSETARITAATTLLKVKGYHNITYIGSRESDVLIIPYFY